MSPRFDLVVRGGTVADGRGGGLYEADVAVSGSRIVKVGRVTSRGHEEIEARGMLVTPGFVDPHSHYDGQITWSNRLDPSSDHGVTTTMMGNCGVGFAPCIAENRDRMIRLMEGVEDIPGVVLKEGLPWNWVSFPEYLNSLAGKTLNVDVAAQFPHAPLRVHVMGQRGADGEPATPQDIAAMAELAEEAMAAGAFGFSTSRTLNHQTSDGHHTPSYTAAEDELTGIANGLRTAGTGHLQLVSDFENPEQEFHLLRRVVESSGRPMFYSLNQLHSAPDKWRTLLDMTDEANAAGVPIRAMVSGRPVGVLMGFDLSLNPFIRCASYDTLAKLTAAERIAALRTREVRQRLLTELAHPREPRHPIENTVLMFDELYPFGDPPEYAPTRDLSIAARAVKENRSPAEVAYDAMLEEEGSALLYLPVSNFSDNTLNAAFDMMRRDNTVLGLADGGAHLGMICDASMTTHILTYWTRDRQGAKFSVADAVKMLTSEAGKTIGLSDRGIVAAGYKADLNVIDYDHLQMRSPRVRRDLPAGGRRLFQQATGYVATVLSGVIVARHDSPTDALPGRLLRNGEPALRSVSHA